MIEIVLVANAVWFGLGFHLFSFRNTIFAKILVPKAHRETPVLKTVAATGPFLGGFNFSFCVLSVVLLLNMDLFPGDEQRVVLFAVIAIAHGSQFFANVPIALENRRGKGVWQVKGLMAFIFTTDFVLMIANSVVALAHAW